MLEKAANFSHYAHFLCGKTLSLVIGMYHSDLLDSFFLSFFFSGLGVTQVGFTEPELGRYHSQDLRVSPQPLCRSPSWWWWWFCFFNFRHTIAAMVMRAAEFVFFLCEVPADGGGGGVLVGCTEPDKVPSSYPLPSAQKAQPNYYSFLSHLHLSSFLYRHCITSSPRPCLGRPFVPSRLQFFPPRRRQSGRGFKIIGVVEEGRSPPLKITLTHPVAQRE